MDIHKPKPWHGVREFLKEYVIIVVGVLTALGAEQTVEWLHWRYQVAQTEAALLPEVQINMLNSYERVVDRACMSRRIAELRDLLLRPGPAWKAAALAPAAGAPTTDLNALSSMSRQRLYPGAMPLVFSTPTRPWGSGVWAAALSSGVVNHMSRDRASAYAGAFRSFEQMKEAQDVEQAARTHLAALAFDRQLSETDKTQFLNVLGELNAANERASGLGAQIIKSGAQAGFRVKASDARRRLALIAASRADCYQPVSIPLAPG